MREHTRRKQFMAYLETFSRPAQQTFFIMAAGAQSPTTARQVHEVLSAIGSDINSDLRPGENAMLVPSLAEVQAAFEELAAGELIKQGEGEHWHPITRLEVTE